MDISNKKYICGGLSGIIEVFATHPLDYIKTKKQEHSQIRSNLGFIQYLKNNGKINIYSGVIPRVCGVIPMRFIFWGVQDNSYSFINKNYSLNKCYVGIMSGIIGGTCQTVIDNPIEIIKIKMMTNQKIAFKDLIQNRGFNATLLRNCGFATCISSVCFNKNERSNLDNFIYSATAGMTGSIITQPIDYVKTQQQRTNDNKNIYKILKETYNDSPKKLFSGGLNRSLLSFFSMGIGYVAYDNLFKLL